jgi:excisionase family DNA binding protein
VSGRLLRTRDVAELLDVSVETVLRWHRSGKLPGGYRLASNVLRFRESDLERWLDGAQERPGAEEEVAPVPFTAPGRRRMLAGAPVPNRGGDDAS